MPLISCPKGHFYDDAQHASCPWCQQIGTTAGGAAEGSRRHIEPAPGAAVNPPPSLVPPTPVPDAPDVTYGFTKTEAVFTGRVKSIYDMIVPPDEPEGAGAAEEAPVSPAAVKALAITGGVFFLVLAVLPWFGAADYHSYIYSALYALCAGLCAMTFRYRYVNAAVVAAAVIYMSFCFLTDFTNFDYYIFIMALSVLPLLGSGRRYRVAVAVLVLVCAFVCSFLVVRAMYEIKLGGKHTFVAGSLAVPLLMLWASPTGPLLSQRGENQAAELCGVAIPLAMQFFPAIAFIIAAVVSLARHVPTDAGGALFHIADAGYIGISQGRFPWWPKYRFLAQIVQAVPFSSLFVLALARLSPRAFRAFRTGNAVKLSLFAIGFIFLIMASVVAVSMMFDSLIAIE